MILRLLLCIAMSLANAVRAEPPVPLHQALAEGKLTAQVTALGVPSGDALLLSVRRAPDTLPFRLVLEAGTRFRPDNIKQQTMAGLRIRGEMSGDGKSEIPLDEDRDYQLLLEAFSLNITEEVPNLGDAYQIEAPTAQLTAFLVLAWRSRVGPKVLQAGLWIEGNRASDAAIRQRFLISAAQLTAAHRLVEEFRQRYRSE